VKNPNVTHSEAQEGGFREWKLDFLLKERKNLTHPTAFMGLQENQRPHRRTSQIVYLVQGHISAYVPHVSGL